MAGNSPTPGGTREEGVQKESRAGEREGAREVGLGEDGDRQKAARGKLQGNFCLTLIFKKVQFVQIFFVFPLINFVVFQANSDEIVRPRTRDEYDHQRQRNPHKPARYKVRFKTRRFQVFEQNLLKFPLVVAGLLSLVHMTMRM